MRIRLIVLFAALGVCFSGPASAQHTTCMAMGSDMLSCDTIGGYESSQQPDGGEALGKGLMDMINGIGEKNFRKKVGKLLAEGNCEAASRLALEKGRLEMGLALREMCSQRAAAGQAVDLRRRLQAVASSAKTPASYSDELTITAVQAAGSELWLTVNYSGAGPVPVEDRKSALREICTSDAMRPLLLEGASIVTFYLDPRGTRLNSDSATAASCGLI